MNIKTYSIKKAIERTNFYSGRIDQNLWIANKMLKESIKRRSFSGENRADVEVTLYTSGVSFDDIYQIETIIDDLADCYKKEGYSTCIEELSGSLFKIEGYRLTVLW